LMSNIYFVAESGEIAFGKARVVKVGRIDVAVFNVEGKFYAIKDSCPHQGDSLSRGCVDGTILTCPGHGCKFDLKTGRCVKGDEEISLRTFDTTIEGKKLCVIQKSR
jgi:3-phenylpropionate/trans-cinnamate dioxygenase ferredoxin subunit